MIKTIRIDFLFVLLSSTAFSRGKKVYNDGYFVKIGDVAPDFLINEAGGKSHRLPDLKGKKEEEFKQMKKIIFDELTSK